jgi:hypothetical protein
MGLKFITQKIIHKVNDNMSTKIKKIARTKDWIDEIVIKVKATINEGAELCIDQSLLPQELQEKKIGGL